MAEKIYISKIFENDKLIVLSRLWPITKISYVINRAENILECLCFYSNADFDGNADKGFWQISYQKNFVFILSNNKKIKISTPNNKACGNNIDTPFIKELIKFIDSFNHGDFDGSDLRLINEVEFMDI